MRSTFYRRSGGQRLEDTRLVEQIAEICAEYPSYAYRRVTLQLRRNVVTVLFFPAANRQLDLILKDFYKYETMKKSTVITALGALAQETRLDIFRLLVQKGPEGLPAGEIGTRLGQPSPTMSFHLNQLRFAGLVSSRRESRSIIYRANFKAMSDLLTYLTENCCGGRTELCAPVAAPGCASECAPEQTVTSKRIGGCLYETISRSRQGRRPRVVSTLYSTLFGTEPAVLKADYAKWMLDDPRVNFAITAGSTSTGLDHLGLQVESDEDPATIAGRLDAAGQRS